MNTLVSTFHPGNKEYTSCEKKFKTSTYGNGGVLFYENAAVISTSELIGVCKICDKFSFGDCGVHKELIQVLECVEKKK